MRRNDAIYRFSVFCVQSTNRLFYIKKKRELKIYQIPHCSVVVSPGDGRPPSFPDFYPGGANSGSHSSTGRWYGIQDLDDFFIRVSVSHWAFFGCFSSLRTSRAASHRRFPFYTLPQRCVAPVCDAACPVHRSNRILHVKCELAASPSPPCPHCVRLALEIMSTPHVFATVSTVASQWRTGYLFVCFVVDMI